ncbi:glycoside hydrolase N-terminal domain-containing protein [Fodinicola feengrottensis]|uniref:glycoside hydrolase N-terminal domain-containing protein n=1 Tax=Fodinicola feengrottensis TaxID=435914 RepID=UPI0013D767AE|nr:glycoside hydrolase N-terminal domain-containing protein [Fodinicola feengrottensis]
MTFGDLLLGWPRPAESWYEAVPIGNGRLGAMVFGGVSQHRLQINDSTVWSGTPQGPADGLAEVLATGAGPERLAELREAIRAQDYRRAEALVKSFEGRYSQEYLPFVDLWMSFAEGEQAIYHGRTLNIDNGVAADSLRYRQKARTAADVGQPAGAGDLPVRGRRGRDFGPRPGHLLAAADGRPMDYRGGIRGRGGRTGGRCAAA